MALLGPGLAIGALLHVNDILSADLLPGTLFLQEGPSNRTDTMVSMPLTGAAPHAHQDAKTYGGNWSDAFLTMNFHRRMMNEYLCRGYVAEQILGDMTGLSPAPVDNVEVSSDPANAAALTASPPTSRRRISSTLFVGDRRVDQDEDGVEDTASGLGDVKGGLRSGASANGTADPAVVDAAPPLPAPPADTRRRAVDEPRSNLPAFRRKAVLVEPASASDGKRRRRKRRRRKKRPGSGPRRTDAKDSLLADEGSAAYKDWLARTTLLEDIYRHYDNMASASDGIAATMPHAAQADTATFEGGEVTGFAMTHAAAAPPTVLGQGLGASTFSLPAQHVPLPGLSSLGLHSHGLNLASSVNSFASPVSPGHALGVGEDRNPFEYGGGEYLDSHEHYDHPEHHEHEHPEYEHHEHLEKGHHGKMLSLKDLFDLVLTAIAFLAFGAFAVQLIMYLMMIPNNNNMMMVEVPAGNGDNDGGTDNGAGEGEGGRRRRRRAAPGPGAATPLLPAVSPEVLNRAAQRVLASIDAAMLVYQPPRRRAGGRSLGGDAWGAGKGAEPPKAPDNRDCLHRALCKHNRFSRAMEGPFRLWMPIWSVGMSWVAGRLSPGSATPAVATLDNLRASLLGLGNARCSVVFPRCDGVPSGVRPARPAPAPDVGVGHGDGHGVPDGAKPHVTTPGSTAPEDTATSATRETTVSAPATPPTPAPAGLAVGHGIIHPAYSDLPKIIALRPTGGAAAAPSRTFAEPSHFTAIGVKTNKNKKRRRPGPHASARKRQAPRRQS